MSLRDQVETLLPGWESWYPNVFDAAVDLGLIRARVCPPGALMLSRRHASVYNEALQAFREQWSVVESEGGEANSGQVGDERREHDYAERIESDASHSQ